MDQRDESALRALLDNLLVQPAKCIVCGNCGNQVPIGCVVSPCCQANIYRRSNLIFQTQKELERRSHEARINAKRAREDTEQPETSRKGRGSHLVGRGRGRFWVFSSHEDSPVVVTFIGSNHVFGFATGKLARKWLRFIGLSSKESKHWRDENGQEHYEMPYVPTIIKKEFGDAETS